MSETVAQALDRLDSALTRRLARLETDNAALLAACRVALDALGDAQANHRGGKMVDTSGERDQLRFAIDKATGGQP